MTLQLLSVTSTALAQSSSSTGSSSSSDSSSPTSGVVASTVTYSGRYPINWALVPSTVSSLSIPSDTELGPCICDLTWSSCDVQCLCDPDCSATEKEQFSAGNLLPDGPVDTKILTCLDPSLVSVNARGALTVSLIDNMLCVAQDNSQKETPQCKHLQPYSSKPAARRASTTVAHRRYIVLLFLFLSQILPWAVSSTLLLP